jgi:hypothetical protein
VDRAVFVERAKHGDQTLAKDIVDLVLGWVGVVDLASGCHVASLQIRRSSPSPACGRRYTGAMVRTGAFTDPAMLRR